MISVSTSGTTIASAHRRTGPPSTATVARSRRLAAKLMISAQRLVLGCLEALPLLLVSFDVAWPAGLPGASGLELRLHPGIDVRDFLYSGGIELARFRGELGSGRVRHVATQVGNH